MLGNSLINTLILVLRDGKCYRLEGRAARIWLSFRVARLCTVRDSLRSGIINAAGH